MRARSIVVIMLAAIAAAIGVSWPNGPVLGQSAEPVQLTPGFTRLIRFDRSIATVVVGNPEVADARAQTDRAIVLVGKAVGITNLVALDASGAEVYSSLVIVGARDAGKVIVHARSKLHEYWAYRCTADNCVRVEDRLEYLQPTAPIVVAPTPAGQPVQAAPPSQ